MKKSLLFTLSVLLFCGMTRLPAQTNSTTVADGTTTSSYIPIYGLYMSSWLHTQILYPAEMLGDMVGGTISEISFYTQASAFNYDWAAPMRVKMGITPSSSIATSDYLTDSTETVYIGTLSAVTGVMNIVFDSAFTYTGGNLLLEFITEVKTPNYKGATFKGIATENNMSIRGYNANGLGSIVNQTRHKFIPKTTFTYTGGVSCLSPKAVTAENVSEYDVTVHIAPRAGQNQWEYLLATSNEDTTGMLWTPTTDTLFVLNGLTDNTAYTVYARTLCDGSSHSATTYANFRTLCSLISEVPVLWDFETDNVEYSPTYPMPACWSRLPSTSQNPHVYSYLTTHSHSGAHLLYFTSTSAANLAILPEIDTTVLPISNLQLSFYPKTYSSGQSMDLIVGVIGDPTDNSTFQPYDTIHVNSSAYDSEPIIVMFNAFTGYGNRFAMRVDNPSTTLMYLCVDDILLEEIPECPKVQHLTVTSISESSVGLTWDGMNDSYLARYQVEGDTVWNYQTTLTDTIDISGLQPNTTYLIEIAPYCEEVTDDMYRQITVITGCTATSAPYFIDFETESMMHCWTIAQEGVIEDSFYGDMHFPALETSSTNAYSGTRYLEVGAQNGSTAVFVAPKITQNIEDLRIKFYTREPQNLLGANVLGTLQVGLMTDAMDVSTFASVDTVPVSGTSYTLNTIDFDQSGYTGGNYYIAFRYIGNGSSDEASGIFMDDITITIITSCPEPTALNVTNVTQTTADLSWSGTASEYVVYYRKANEMNFSSVPAILDSGTFTLPGLQSSTHYYWYVSAICPDSTEAPSVINTFMTECGTYTVFPYHENLNGYASNMFPDCWLRLDGSTETTYTFPMTFMNTNTFHYAHSLPTCMVLGSNSTHSATAIMPHFSENLQSLRVSFYARPENSSSGVLHVGYITNPADSSTFVSVYQIDPTFLSDNNYHQYVVDFSSQTAPDSARIAFRYVTNSEWYFLLDDITVSIIPNCFAPLQLSSTGVTSTTAYLTWLSNIDTLELYYKYAAEPDWNMEIAALDSTGYYHLTGLTPSKTYTWYVVAPCDGNLFESATSTFTTDCAGIASVPRTWTFETGNSAGTTSNPLPACWHRTDSQFPYSYHASLYNFAHTGDRCLFFNTNGGNLYATLPAIDTTELLLDTLQLKFYARTYNSSQTYTLDVGVMTDPMDPNTFELVQSYYLTSGSYPAVAFRTNFTNYTGHGSFIAFRCLAASSANAYVDDVTLQRKPDCEPVDNLTITDITTTTVTLTWTEEEDIVTFIVEHQEEGNTTWLADTVNGLTGTVSGLTPGTDYLFRVRPLCNDAVDYASASCHTQCEAITIFPYYESFEDGAFGCWMPQFIVQNGSSWQNHTVNSMGQYPAHGSHYVFYHQSAVNSYSEGLLVSPVFDFSSTPYPKITFSYDALGDGVHNDTLALLYRTSPTDSWHYLAGWGCHDDLDASWKIDSVALPSPTATYQVAFKTVSFNGYGIFLDNIIVLNVAPPVIDPTVVTYDATNVTSFSAELNGAITDPGNQTILNSGFEWKVTGPNSFQMVSVTGNPLNYVLTGLIPNTNYSYRAIATTSNGTVYGELKTFTTLELSNDTCETPTNLQQMILLTETETGVIIVTWTDNAGATQWNLQYRLPGSTWTSAVVTGAPTYTITDLQPNTQYEIQVQAICESSMSEWSDVLIATSSIEDGITNHLGDRVHLYPNPAKEYIDVVLDGNMMKIHSIEVFDVYGKVIRTDVGANNYSPVQTRINVSGMTSGMYFVRLNTSAGTVTKNFIKH